MAEQAGDAGCVVVVLAPRQDGRATLCRVPSASGRGAVCALPTVVVSAEPGTDEVVRAVSRLVGAPVTLLRANAAAWDAGFDTTAMLVEIGPLSTEPRGFCWVLVSESDVETVEPAWARDSMRSWTRERVAGWSDLRPQWSRPGWLAEAAQWMHRRPTNPHASPTHASRSQMLREPAPAHVLATPSPRSTELPAPTSTGPTPKGLNEWERKALELSEERNRLG